MSKQYYEIQGRRVLHDPYIYRPQRSWAKVMFLQASVILSTGGSASVHGGIPPREQTPPQIRPPREQTHPPPVADTTPRARLPRTRPPPDQAPPPGSRLQHTVNERPVRILLECNLVLC